MKDLGKEVVGSLGCGAENCIFLRVHFGAGKGARVRRVFMSPRMRRVLLPVCVQEAVSSL